MPRLVLTNETEDKDEDAGEDEDRVLDTIVHPQSWQEDV